MIRTAGLRLHSSAAAFDSIAESYDDTFTRTPIGRAQRNVVWRALLDSFRPGDRILELNCGTGEDAFFLSGKGMQVVACDASPGMIEVARRRESAESIPSPIDFRVLRTEEIGKLQPKLRFDGVLSNFSGLNCIGDLKRVASDLQALTRPGAPVCICLSTRFCLWEILWFTLHGNLHKAFRRIRGSSVARVGGQPVSVSYPTIRAIRRSFAPWFRLRTIRAVGLTVPPTFVRARVFAQPAITSYLERLDAVLGRWPLFRAIGDHVLLTFESVSQ